jgi:MFS family permease
MLGWGLVTMFMGFAFNFSGLVACRWFLGMFEAGLLPGCVYVVTMWYKRHEGSRFPSEYLIAAQKRVTIFFSASTMAGAFAGLLAYLINLMDGTRGYRSWRWVPFLTALLNTDIHPRRFINGGGLGNRILPSHWIPRGLSISF